MSLKITIMGCGNSSGVPSVGNYWGACDPNEPKNRRSRCSVAVQSVNTTLIIDTGPDFREQLNKFNINNLDSVLYTHQHSDHSHGIDDLRSLYFRHKKEYIDVYGRLSVLQEISTRFHYMFEGGNDTEFYPPILKANPFTESNYSQTKTIGDIGFIPFEMDHGTCQSVGYRFGDISYCVDMKSLNQKALDVIKGSRIWIVDGAGYQNPNNAVHADLESIYRYNDYIKAEQVYITSLSTQMDYQTLRNEMPEGFYPAYDGLVLKVTS